MLGLLAAIRRILFPLHIVFRATPGV